MKKTAISLAILTLIAIISSYLYVQNNLIPNLIVDLESYLSDNTHLNLKIDRPKLNITKIIFPRIEIAYQDKTVFISNLTISPSLAALLDKHIEVTGSGILQINKEKLDFKILDSIYDIETKKFSLSLETIEEPVKKILHILSNITGAQLPDNLTKLNGKCKTTLFLKSNPTENVDLKANLYIENSELKINNARLISSDISIDYVLKSKTSSLAASVENFKVYDIKSNSNIIEQGHLLAESDLKTIKLTELRAINNSILWQGTAEITNLAMHPTLNFNITSNLFNSVGEIRKISDTINFKADIYKDKSMLHARGHYDIEKYDLDLTGKGSIELETLLSYMNLPKESYLNKLSSYIKIEEFQADYNIKNTDLTASSYMVLSNTSYDNNIIAKSGSLDLKLNGKNLIIENLYLGDRSSSIQAMGNLTIKDRIPFKIDIYIRNYAIEQLLKPFLDKDIGNGLLFANSAIKGDMQDLNSIIGICKWEFREGNLGKLKFLSQIASLINKPGLNEISFTQGKGSLNFQKSILQSPESVLISDYVNILLSGAINTAGKLDVTVVTEFPEEEHPEETSSPFGKIGDILSLGVQEFFHKIKITGTVEKPKYTLIPVNVGRILQNIISN